MPKRWINDQDCGKMQSNQRAIIKGNTQATRKKGFDVCVDKRGRGSEPHEREKELFFRKKVQNWLVPEKTNCLRLSWANPDDEWVDENRVKMAAAESKIYATWYISNPRENAAHSTCGLCFSMQLNLRPPWSFFQGNICAIFAPNLNRSSVPSWMRFNRATYYIYEHIITVLGAGQAEGA